MGQKYDYTAERAQRLLGSRGPWRCTDGITRELTIIDVVRDGMPGHWVLTGRDAQGTRHRAMTRYQRPAQSSTPKTDQQQKIHNAAGDLLALLDELVPDSTIHYVVEAARQELTTLVMQAHKVKTHDDPR